MKLILRFEYENTLLEISNSTFLHSAEDLFALANNVQVKRIIRFENLGITEIPDYAFKMNYEISTITIIDNPITRIGKKCF